MESNPLHVVAAAILREGRCLVARRGAGMRLAGKWEFPGGKVRPGEAAAAAVVREIREELGLEVRIGHRLGVGTTPEVRLEVYLAELEGGRLELREHAEARWISADEIGDLDWAAADLPVLAALRRELGG